MSFFTDTDVEAAFDSEQVHMAELFKIDFKSGVQRYSTENVGFTDAEGHRWEAKGNIVRWSEFDIPTDGVVASNRTYTLPMLDQDIPSIAVDTEENEYRGREICHYVQVFDADSKPIGKPFNFVPFFMDQLSSSWNPNGVAEINLACEGLFVKRNAPSYSYVNDAHQKALYPTDRGLERQHLVQAETHYQWPE